MGPRSLHLFLFETPSLFLPSSIPSHVTACPLQTLPSGRRGLSRLHRVPRPQAAARAVSKPQDSLGTGCSGWAPEFWGMCFENRKGRDQGPKEPQVLPATGSLPHSGQTVRTWRWDYERQYVFQLQAHARVCASLSAVFCGHATAQHLCAWGSLWFLAEVESEGATSVKTKNSYS